MKKAFAVLVLVLLSGTALSAQTRSELGCMALVGYNTTWGVYSGADFIASSTYGNTEYAAVVEALTSNVYDVALMVRPGVDLGSGRLFFETTVNCRDIARNEMVDFVSAESIGWRTKHFIVQAGMYTRVLGDKNKAWHSEEEFICEPFTCMYRIGFNVKGDEAVWDFWGGMSNQDLTQFERFYHPMFYLGGRYDISEKLRAVAQLDFKPAGMFHLDASFYGVICRAGVSYRF